MAPAMLLEALTGYKPPQWQLSLFGMLEHGTIPSELELPPGVGGHNSVLPIWLVARAAKVFSLVAVFNCDDGNNCPRPCSD